LTFAFVDLSWVIFRAKNLPAMARVYSAMFSAIPKIPINLGVKVDPAWLALLAAILLAALPVYSYILARKMKPVWWTAALASVLLTTVVLRFASVSYFLYYFF
jgi:D-alanyl-lipoteichoic acid acyltransferase DltB (MBOAT superfamily)